MNSLDRLKLKMQYTGNSLREENIFNSIKLLDEVFNDDASCTMGIYMWSVGKTGKEFYKDDILLPVKRVWFLLLLRVLRIDIYVLTAHGRFHLIPTPPIH